MLCLFTAAADTLWKVAKSQISTSPAAVIGATRVILRPSCGAGPKDVYIIFYASRQKKWQGRNGWHDPDEITQWLLADARKWLEMKVQEHRPVAQTRWPIWSQTTK